MASATAASPGPAAGPASFFNQLLERFADARQRSRGCADRSFSFGNSTVRLRFATDVMEDRVCRALEHVAVDDGRDPDLTVMLWDSRSTGSPMVPPPWGSDAYGRHGVIEGFNDDRFQTVFDPVCGSLVMLDRSTGQACCWMHDGTRMPDYERAAPLRTLLHLWCLGSDWALLHAGAVGTADGAVLLVGAGGTGKSTTALACLAAGLDFLADDFCMAGMWPEPEVASLYCTGKVDDSAFGRIPLPAGMVDNPRRRADEKAILFLRKDFAGRIVRRRPLRALLVPRVSPVGRTAIEPVSAAVMTTLVGPNTTLMLPNPGSQVMRITAELARRLPCYRFEVGADSAAIAAAVRELLVSLAARH